MTDAQIKHMVDRFLGWKLPRDTFHPDCGISFNREPINAHTPYPSLHEPIGTNLFDYEQATAMVRYMAEGLPIAIPAVADSADFQPAYDGEEYVTITFRVPKDTRVVPGIWELKACEAGSLPWAKSKAVA